MSDMAREKAWREYRDSGAHKHHGATKRPFMAGYDAAQSDALRANDLHADEVHNNESERER